MPRRSLARSALLAVATSGALTAGVVTAPLAHADTTQPPGFSLMPEQSQAGWNAAPWSVPHGRKLR